MLGMCFSCLNVVLEVSTYTFGLQTAICLITPIFALCLVEACKCLCTIHLVSMIKLKPFFGHIGSIGFIFPLCLSLLRKNVSCLWLLHPLAHHGSKRLALTNLAA